MDVEPDENDDESFDEAPTKRPKRQIGLRQNTGNFQCLSKNDGKQKELNPNKRTIEVVCRLLATASRVLTVEQLTEMQQYYERTKDNWRSLTYRKAIGILKRQATKISFASEALQ